MINRLGNVVWSEADITAYTEGKLRERYSEVEERILARVALGAALSMYSPTEAESARLAAFYAAAVAARELGETMRVENALLAEAIAWERAPEEDKPAISPEAVILVAERAAAGAPATPEGEALDA